jgi:HK97 family phage portal protein
MRIFPRTRKALSQTWAAFRADAGLGMIGSPSPDSDYWYNGLGYQSGAGPNVSPGTATRLSAVYSCTRVCAETLSSLPITIFREQKSGTREPAPDHPAYEVFQEPNSLQTSMEFFEMMQGHLELRGNSYAIKVAGRGRAIDELIPVHPDRVKVYLLPNHRLRYEISDYATGGIQRYSMDEILHFRAWSFDGVMGISTVSANAEVIGVGLAQQEHRGRYFRNNAVPGLAVEGPKMTPEAAEEMKNSLAEGYSGENAFKAMIVPPGRQVKALGLTNRDSQLIEASSATRLEVCAAWRVPPHKIGDLSRGTFSNIEQQNIEFATDCIRPRVERIERRLDRDIVGSLRFQESAMGEFFAVFNMDALFRGDMKSRYEAYTQAAFWMLRNEMRRREGLNPIDGLDEPLVAVNMETVDQAERRSQANATAAASVNDPSSPGDLDEAGGSSETPGEDPAVAKKKKAEAREARFRALVVNNAGRVVRREVKALEKLAEKAQDGQVAIEAQVFDFYRTLAPVVAETLVLPLSEASIYCSGHAAFIATSRCDGLKVAIERIADSGAAELAALVLGKRIQVLAA